MALFVLLQVLDVATTLLGLRLGLSEASPFVAALLSVGPVSGLLLSKAAAFLLATGLVATGRSFRLVNRWFLLLVAWNVVLINFTLWT